MCSKYNIVSTWVVISYQKPFVDFCAPLIINKSTVRYIRKSEANFATSTPKSSSHTPLVKVPKHKVIDKSEFNAKRQKKSYILHVYFKCDMFILVATHLLLYLLKVQEPYPLFPIDPWCYLSQFWILQHFSGM